MRHVRLTTRLYGIGQGTMPTHQTGILLYIHTYILLTCTFMVRDRTTEKEEQRSNVQEDCGALCVMISGDHWVLKWFVDNLDTQQMVRELKHS